MSIDIDNKRSENKIEELIDKIEHKQFEYLDVIEKNEKEINRLMVENESLLDKIKLQEDTIKHLNDEIERLKSQYEKKINEMNTILKLTNKINEQEKEIKELKEITSTQDDILRKKARF